MKHAVRPSKFERQTAKFSNRAMILILMGLGILAFALSGCTQNQYRDSEDAALKDPDSVDIYTNVDEHPNIVRLCIDGVAFATTTREYEPVFLVPDWNDYCETKEG